MFELTALEVDADLVGKHQLGHAEIGDFYLRIDFSGLAEIGVIKNPDRARDRRFDRIALRGFENFCEILFRIRWWFLGGEDQMVTRRLPKFAECLMAGFGVDRIEPALGDGEIGLRFGEHRVVVDRAGEHGGDAFGLAGCLLFHLLFVAVDQIRFRFGEFRFGKSMLDRAAKFALENRHDLAPAVVGGGDVDRPELDVVEEDFVQRRAFSDWRIFFL